MLRQYGGTPRGSQGVYVRPVSFTGECGSLASILFHELIHVIGMKDDEEDQRILLITTRIRLKDEMNSIMFYAQYGCKFKLKKILFFRIDIQ